MKKASAYTDGKNSKKNYLNLARELKKLRNMKATVIPIVIGLLGMIQKGWKN